MAENKRNTPTVGEKTGAEQGRALTAIRRQLESVRDIAAAAKCFHEARDDDHYDAASVGVFQAIEEMIMAALHIGEYSIDSIANRGAPAKKGGAA